MRAFPLLAVLLPLCACQLEGAVEVVRDDDTLGFVATADDGGPGCIRGISVRDTGAEATEYSWAIVREEVDADDPCLSRVNYGVVPGGFTQTTQPAPLEAGREYEVRVKGPGWDASTLFPGG